ncbi:hypothetical protein [Paracoccus beibuensis]|uniref:hypothetical protein n=1 Tax=Paracoccus beibuensis TaxID=547602 RepID=UPI00223F6212|nr:hypothetical protein [Paracoccus beibuensis]
MADIKKVPDNRLMLIDYGTNLEVLFSNPMLGSEFVQTELLRHANLGDLASCRCIVRLAHSAVPKIPKNTRISSRKGVQFTDELENVIENLQRNSTCWHANGNTETYTFDFLITEATRKALAYFWSELLPDPWTVFRLI